MKFVKKIYATFISVVLSFNIVGGMPVSAEEISIYDNSFTADNIEQYFVIGMEKQPIACYEQAKEIGVNEFIKTEEGQAAYHETKLEHTLAINDISKLIGRNPKIKYHYTASFNGFSAALSLNEAILISNNAEELGIKHIEYGSPAGNYNAAVQQEKQSEENTETGTYQDITEKIFEKTGITQSGLDGEGTVIAIIDNEIDYAHEFFDAPENFNGKLSKSDVTEVYPYLAASDYVSGACYMNEKIPYRFNYGKLSFDTNNYSVSHGTHVAGIAGGNGEAETDSLYNPRGTAPGAQLLCLSSDGLFSDELIAAYDDALYLGADIINASYGAVGATVNSYKAEVEAINNIVSTGTIFCTAAGNDGKYFGTNDIFTDYSSGGMPDNIGGVVTVGSVDNIAVEKRADYVVMSDGSEAVIRDSSYLGLVECYMGESFEYAVVPGYGRMEDYDYIDAIGKIVLVNAGEISFEEKLESAENAGAVGVLICNNDDKELEDIPTYSLPVSMISQQDGEKLSELEEKTITFEIGFPVIEIDENINVSYYSSWDFTEQLLLKPDICGFGGDIISSIADMGGSHEAYEFLSGTSMSSPQLAGMSALLKQHILAYPEKYEVGSRSCYTELAAKLLMSTSKPVYTSDEFEIASPRVQGNGLANIYDAITTPCYISSDSEKDNYRPKISLGDGYKQQYVLDFNIHNISDSECTYSLNADLFKDDANENGELALNTLRLTDGKDYSVTYFDETGKQVSEVNVSADSSIKLSAKIKLSDSVYKKIQSDNGRFIDGFISLSSEINPNLTLSFMAFCGNWADASGSDVLFDFGYESDEEICSLLCDGNENIAGANIMDYTLSMPAFSPSEDNVFDELALSLAFKRRCYDITAVIYNSAGKKIYEEYLSDTAERIAISGSQYNNVYTLGWDFKENGVVKNGEDYTVEISAVLPLSEKSVVIGSQSFVVDTEKPVIKSVKKLNGLDGQECAVIEAEDNVLLQGALVYDKSGSAYAQNEMFVQSSNSSVSGKYIVIPINNISNNIVRIYDIAGNYTEISADDIDEELYLGSDKNMYFATTDDMDLFSDKVYINDGSGNTIDIEVTGDITPYEVYEFYGSEETVVNYFIDGFNIGDCYVSVGVKGDANSDGLCNVRDAAYIAKMMANKSSEEYCEFMNSLSGYCSDVNNDNDVNVRDAAALAKSLAEGKMNLISLLQ